MSTILLWLLTFSCLLFLPSLTIGIIRKTKARLQNRVGAPLWQHLFDTIKLLRKSETVSENSSWILRVNTVINISIMITLAFLTPWLSFKPATSADDLFLLIYLFAAIRFFAILSSLDPGSAFGAFGASREATLSVLVEPAIILALSAVALSAHTSNLSLVFALTANTPISQAPLWLLAGAGLFLSSLVELSRMPVDDPTTHLELTMVHEAMMLENSGPNLALLEFSSALRLVVLYGLSGQCFLHALHCIWPFASAAGILLSISIIFALAVVTSLIETVSVRLKWTRAPEFVAYGLTMSLLALLVALVTGVSS